MNQLTLDRRMNLYKTKTRYIVIKKLNIISVTRKVMKIISFYIFAQI